MLVAHTSSHIIDSSCVDRFDDSIGTNSYGLPISVESFALWIAIDECIFNTASGDRNSTMRLISTSAHVNE